MLPTTFLPIHPATGRPAPRLFAALLALALLPACSGVPGVGGDEEPALPAELVVEITAQGDPLLDGEPTLVGQISQQLREADPTPALILRLPPGVPLERLWEVRERLAAGQERLLRGATFELPVAAGEGAGGLRAFQPLPPFVVVGQEEVRVGRDGARPIPLLAMDELFPFAAGISAADPDAVFILTWEEGVAPERLATAREWLERGAAGSFLAFDRGGLRPLDEAAPEAAGGPGAGEASPRGDGGPTG